MQTVSPATFSTHSCQQWETVNNVVKILAYAISRPYTQGDSDVISMPAGCRRHLVGKTFINVFHCDSAEMRFVGKIVIIQTFS